MVISATAVSMIAVCKVLSAVPHKGSAEEEYFTLLLVLGRPLVDFIQYAL